MATLFYIIGASGAGKDTLINYARSKFDGTTSLVFAHRYITREPFKGSENHIYLTTREFDSRRSGDLFSLWWESNGQQYGIGIEVDQWLKKGFDVVVNGSRQHLPVARRLYPDLQAILIEASPSIIAQRLESRGRESEIEIKSRIKRTAEINFDLETCIRIQNNGTLEQAGEELINLLSIGR